MRRLTCDAPGDTKPFLLVGWLAMVGCSPTTTEYPVIYEGETARVLPHDEWASDLAPEVPANCG